MLHYTGRVTVMMSDEVISHTRDLPRVCSAGASGKMGLFLRCPGQCVQCHGIHYTGGTHHDLAGDMEHRGRMHHYWRRRGEDTLPRLG